MIYPHIMLYRPCPDMDPPDDADLDDPAMAAAAVGIEAGERDLRTLSRLTEIAMELAEAQGVYAKARLAAAMGKGDPLEPNEDPAAPFNKIAQTVRRTIALKAKLAKDARAGADHLTAERVARRAKRDAEHSDAKSAAVLMGFRDAVGEEHPDLESEGAERLFDGMEQLFYEDEDFSDFLDRPVGETVARLCKTLGLDPALCVLEGEAWKIRREPYDFEKPLSPSWGGTGCEASRVGSAETSEPSQTNPAKTP